MGKLFGTDGVRGVANRELTPELAYSLGRAGASVLLRKVKGRRPRVLIGRDTRASGQMLEAALIAGITSSGADVLAAGVIPTPGVAYLTRTLADAGVMISASHNPVADNGIKFFSADGYKLSDDVEEEIEDYLDDAEDADRPIGVDVGRVVPLPDATERYVDFLLSCVDADLRGLRIVVDCGNGAAYRVAPVVLRRLGAQVIALNIAPNGGNINVRCGSTYPQVAADAVRTHSAHVGLTHDGDADRVIAIDENGQVVDGDHILAVCALDLIDRGKLTNKAIAATVYSNMGLRKALRQRGGDVVVTQNGDRYVLAAMREQGLILGGEQSGHIIFLRHNTTGDGVLSGLKLLEVMTKTKRPLSELAAQMKPLPQVLRNVRVRDKDGWEKNENIQEAITRAEKLVEGNGRVFVRASGTEPLIRIMVEGEDRKTIEKAATLVTEVVKDELS